jgi:hypothetical protein
MKLLNKSSVSLLDILYIPGFSVNLFLIKKVYLNLIIKGTFNN